MHQQPPRPRSRLSDITPPSSTYYPPFTRSNTTAGNSRRTRPLESLGTSPLLFTAPPHHIVTRNRTSSERGTRTIPRSRVSVTEGALETCPMGDDHIVMIPPPLSEFFASGSDVLPYPWIDRGLPRCKTCDLIDANKDIETWYDRLDVRWIDSWWVKMQKEKYEKGDITRDRFDVLTRHGPEIKLLADYYAQRINSLVLMISFWGIWGRHKEHDEHLARRDRDQRRNTMDKEKDKIRSRESESSRKKLRK
ncbi:hypothetical protein B0H63DRAFT_472381 [Podospora didyma]|uniref:Uncharacterized protein n=1 Tax=Podospora didyma TaxID=330526 RepID=A0AAE0NP44_9PEZI|nr:hypothetical protein B0H63DRAFT_472381 [Podospora didyma]